MTTNPPPVVAPAIPTNLRRTNRTQNSITIAWNSAARATSYRVYRNGTFRGTTTNLQWTSSGLNANSSHRFTVIAVNSGGTSGHSSQFTTWTLAASAPGGEMASFLQGGGTQIGAPTTPTDKLLIATWVMIRPRVAGRVTASGDTLRVRSSPVIANNNEVRRLPHNAMVIIVGGVNGGAVSGNTLWWRLVCGNYVHSSLIAFVNVPITAGTLPRRASLVRYTRDNADRTIVLNSGLPAGYFRQNGRDGFVNLHPTDALAIMFESRMFMFHGHGSRNGIATDTRHRFDANRQTQYFSINYGMIRALPNNALNRVELVIYAACGSPGTPNLVNATHERGAQTVIGWTDEIHSGTLCIWTTTFMNSITAGNNIDRAIRAAEAVIIENRNRWVAAWDNADEESINKTINNLVTRGTLTRSFP